MSLQAFITKSVLKGHSYTLYQKTNLIQSFHGKLPLSHIYQENITLYLQDSL